jgi:hypothetical protein
MFLKNVGGGTWAFGSARRWMFFVLFSLKKTKNAQKQSNERQN